MELEIYYRTGLARDFKSRRTFMRQVHNLNALNQEIKKVIRLYEAFFEKTERNELKRDIV